ncbi:hypothetical protein DSO57_1024641 [Entomophthora muscae]|uniref:Uncharacterized protein n=1 Tax=Entomophthora muscae TaxID=34485 RepID=A0ACC2SRX1_9FUNG|nr:hypothetical protein DSO57_1024641 [Entomophthora muscae]
MYGVKQVPSALNGKFIPQISAATCFIFSLFGMYGLYGTQKVLKMASLTDS